MIERANVVTCTGRSAWSAGSKPSGRPTPPALASEPSRRYTQPWYGHDSARARPHPSASGEPRWRHTLRNARSCPASSRTTSTGSPPTTVDGVRARRGDVVGAAGADPAARGRSAASSRSWWAGVGVPVPRQRARPFERHAEQRRSGCRARSSARLLLTDESVHCTLRPVVVSHDGAGMRRTTSATSLPHRRGHGGRIELVGLRSRSRRRRGRRRHRPGHRAGRVLLPARPVRVRQDDDAADDRRVRAADQPGRSSSTAATSSPCRRTAGRSTPCSSPTPCSPTSTSRTTSPTGCAGGGRARTRPSAAGASVDAHRAGPPRRASRTRQPAQLSGGQQQRVALARALILRPRCSCSTSRSAPSTPGCARTSRSTSPRCSAEVGITFVYVTHDQEEALTMSHRLAVMDAGPGGPGRHARRGLRAAGDGLRRRLPRRRQPARRRRRAPARAAARRAPRRVRPRRQRRGPGRSGEAGHPPRAGARRRRRGRRPELHAGDGRAGRLRRVDDAGPRSPARRRGPAVADHQRRRRPGRGRPARRSA